MKRGVLEQQRKRESRITIIDTQEAPTVLIQTHYKGY